MLHVRTHGLYTMGERKVLELCEDLEDSVDKSENEMYCDDLEEYQLPQFLNPIHNLRFEGSAGESLLNSLSPAGAKRKLQC